MFDHLRMARKFPAPGPPRVAGGGGWVVRACRVSQSAGRAHFTRRNAAPRFSSRGQKEDGRSDPPADSRARHRRRAGRARGRRGARRGCGNGLRGAQRKGRRTGGPVVAGVPARESRRGLSEHFSPGRACAQVSLSAGARRAERLPAAGFCARAGGASANRGGSQGKANESIPPIKGNRSCYTESIRAWCHRHAKHSGVVCSPMSTTSRSPPARSSRSRPARRGYFICSRFDVSVGGGCQRELSRSIFSSYSFANDLANSWKGVSTLVFF